jgi:hypothetical protein
VRPKAHVRLRGLRFRVSGFGLNARRKTMNYPQQAVGYQKMEFIPKSSCSGAQQRIIQVGAEEKPRVFLSAVQPESRLDSR